MKQILEKIQMEIILKFNNKIRYKTMKKNLQYNSITNMDKSSRSVISKSSRLTKKNPEVQAYEPQLIYFQKNTIGDKVLQRTSVSKSKQKQDKHLDKVGRIIQDLMNRHKKAKQKLQKLKQECEVQHDKQCPFTPKKNSMQRYHIGGDMIRRNQIWLREKKRKQLQLKQTVTLQNLKQCTFSPKFSSKKVSQTYIRFKDNTRTLTPKNGGEKSFPSPFKSKRDFSQAQYQMAKRNLISKMMNALE